MNRFAICVILASGAAIAEAQTPKFVISTVAGVPPVPVTPTQASTVPIGSPKGLAADDAGKRH